MNGDTTADVHRLIERLRRGDDSARNALLERVYHRLRRIAGALFRDEFPRLRARHDLNSVVDEAWMRLMKALEETRPESAEDFYSLMFHKVRHVLLDMARIQSRNDARWRQGPPDVEDPDATAQFDVGDSTYEPARLAIWSEFHREVESLPDKQRLVFDLHYLGEFSQSEIARLLDLHPKQVSRLWLAATGSLAQWLDGIEEMLP